MLSRVSIEFWKSLAIRRHKVEERRRLGDAGLPIQLARVPITTCT